MAVPDDGSRDFVYCNLCRINYIENESHVYSKKHKKTISTLLNKFLAKIKEAEVNIKFPCIKELDSESSIKLWCYFCELEVMKHSINVQQRFVVCHDGFLKHLNSKEHGKNCKRFWWSNRIDISKIEEFILSDEKYESFKVNADVAATEFNTRELLRHQKLVTSICKVEEERRLTVENLSTGESTPEFALTQPSTSQSTEASQANVKMLPPWLLPSDEEPKGPCVQGPSILDYRRHLEQEKKKKLPPNRVGANFDREAANVEDWLPSFGRVWNNGRRIASKKEFDRHQRSHNKRSSCNYNRQIKPYESRTNSSSSNQKYVL